VELVSRGTSTLGNGSIGAAGNLHFDAGPGANNELIVMTPVAPGC